MDKMPKWADVILTPLISLVLAMAISALVILAISESPAAALKTMVDGALGSSYGWGFTLYYTTNFIFTGLAVSVAFHARLFNIGGEGQLYAGAAGAAWVGALDLGLPGVVHLLLSIGVACLLGGVWGGIAGWLKARRGVHETGTCIIGDVFTIEQGNVEVITASQASKWMRAASTR